ncbi:histidine kinase [Blumeria hordei DH14]|uniref:Histidine kinase n=1 Tax=Blumeria graminis f. sp. hordei (strain DH14) TaxID=546991 RepID=N1J8K3_BLUG1|nr:histidine kinase [Blumeria hordei DH14]
MSSPELSDGMSHIDGISDQTRARELYKYYQPAAQPGPDDYSTRQPNLDAPPSPEEVEQDHDLKIDSNVSSSKISSPDTALTVFCQLTAWRTGCQRAMIRFQSQASENQIMLIVRSLIDAETQYFVAESTKSMNLVDHTQHDPGDGLWMGCGSVSKAGRLCERTIAVFPTCGETYPSFVVDDLSKDERFNNLPFVTGPPFLKRYIGVPLITKRGIPIGSLFVVDDKPGNGLSESNNRLMGTMAKTVMRHFELVREVEEHRRGIKMSRGLASFVEGRAGLAEGILSEETILDPSRSCLFGTDTAKHKDKTRDVDSKKTSKVSKFRTQSSGNPKDDRISNDSIAPLELSSDEPEYSQTQTNIPESKAVDVDASTRHSVTNTCMNTPPPGDDSEETQIRALFSRAANIIQKSFEIKGGTIFYDARNGFSETISGPQTDINSTPQSDRQHECDFTTHVSQRKIVGECEPADLSSSSIFTPCLNSIDDASSQMSEYSSYINVTRNRRAEILGFSTQNASSLKGDPVPGSQQLEAFRDRDLHALLRLYPRGKLWTFSSDGTVIPDETLGGGNTNSSESKLETPSPEVDDSFLSQYFPGVHQLLFDPLWDAGRNRWLSCCFTWSTDPMRVLSRQKELSFMTAFGNSVMAEWARIDTEIADQKKSDFIGSISHELRSPLHGILASTEFLEEVTTGWEKQLVETIESCGRTLLDTINHILDFSKINHFESNWRKSKRVKSRAGRSVSVKQSELPMLKLFQDTDISIICEEVIDSVFAGYIFQNTTAHSFDQISDTQGKMSDSRLATDDPERFTNCQKDANGVVVILDINPQDYQVTTQPGALRRLIMNLLGNSLKYTSQGYVKVELDCSDMDDLVTSGPLGAAESVPQSMLTITVTDTGRGISPEFLRSKLFTPFTQENTLSSGTGLGLSIVRAIVSLLEGKITIDSELGKGTKVKVCIPVLRRMPNNTAISVENTRPIMNKPQDAIIDLRSRVVGLPVKFYGFDCDVTDTILFEQLRLLKASISNFLVNWYGMRIVPWEEKAQVIIANVESLASISTIACQDVSIHSRNPSIIALCSRSPATNRMFTLPGTKCKIGYIVKPIGPVKLAKVISQTLGGAPVLQTPDLGSSILDLTDLNHVFDELSVRVSDDELCQSIIGPIDFLETSRLTAPKQKLRATSACRKENARLPVPLETSRNAYHLPTDSPVSKQNVTSSPPHVVPRILVVDDNEINLQLLSTYLRRRAYPQIDNAHNGLEAVQKCEAMANSYDIIFMDLTMPILDGFGATRKIRAMEELRRMHVDLGEGSTSEPSSSKSGFVSAFIIAFTGRSSIEDQNEALSCGIDLFMTKPVAFKEVGKICDNWIANQIQAHAKIAT